MTVIRPNSVSGITSITAQANEINFFRSNGALAGLQLNGVNFNTTTGISTLAALKITGNLDVEGVLTYQDVTNVDSVGIITARSTIDAQGSINLADSIIHTGDTNTKIRFPSADTITFETAGSERLRITSDGKVGVNVTSPTTNLQIGDGTVDSDNVLKFGKRVSSNEGNLPLIGHHSHNGSASSLALSATSSSGCIHFFTGNDADGFGDGNNEERLRITSTGKVGIGTDNPTKNLQIGGDGVDSNNVIRFGKRISSSQTNLPLIGHHSGDGTGSGLALCATSSNGAIHFFTGNDADGFGNGNNEERLRIMTNGNVKIGSGSAAFGVGGGLEIDTGSAATIRLEDSGSTSSFEIQNTGGVIKQNMYNNQPWTVAYNSSEKLRITSNGRVGINTTNPNHTLHVFGKGTQLAIFGDEDSGSYEALGISNAEAGYPAITQESSNDTLDLRSYGSIQATIDSNNNSTGKYFRVMTNGAGNAGTELFKVEDSGNVNVTSGQLQVTGGGLSLLTNNSTIQTGSSSHMLAIQGGATYMGGRIELRGGQHGSSGDIRFYAQGATSTQVERLRIKSNGDVDVTGGILARNPSDNFTLNGVTTPHYGFQLNASSSVPVAFAGYYGIVLATEGTERFRIARTGDISSNVTRQAVSYHALQTPTYWTVNATGSSNQTIDVSSVFGVPDNAKAILVQGWYHVTGYSQGSTGQGDHASSHFSEYQPSGGNPWSFTSSTTTSWGQYVMDHDGDASGPGGTGAYPHYYGMWGGQGIVNVNPNGNIYGRCFWGYSGGTHYNQLWCYGYYI